MSTNNGFIVITHLAECNNCLHKISSTTCRAFPDLIPGEILSGKIQHRKGYPGDQGVRWEPATT